MSTIGKLPESFSSNGEKIYFTGVSTSGIAIQPIPVSSFSNHQVKSCANCHGLQRQGGLRMMPFFWIKSPPLTPQSLFAKTEHESYNATSLAKAIRQGLDPSGETLGSSMPRWKISDSDMQDLNLFLNSK